MRNLNDMDPAVRRLMGLDANLPMFSPEQKQQYLKSKERMLAYDRISTTTMPTKLKADQKRGIVAEVLQKGLTSEEILKHNPTVYLGSGIDVEYPLALGARDVRMVDYIFEDERAVQELAQRVEALTGQKPEIQNREIKFNFDFGEGPEPVVVVMDSKPYLTQMDETKDRQSFYQPPENIGLILGYASQGPSGEVIVDNEIKTKLVDNGAVLKETTLIRKQGSEEQTVELGK